MTTLPNDPEERERALQLAQQARRDRADIRAKLAAGKLSVKDVLDRGAYGKTDESGEHARTAGRMRVSTVLLAVKGIGKTRADKIMSDIGVAGTDRLDTLNKAQREGIVKMLEEMGLQQ
jgi:hypothetical protein